MLINIDRQTLGQSLLLIDRAINMIVIQIISFGESQSFNIVIIRVLGMKPKSLLQQSKNLSSLSLDSFVSDVTSQEQNLDFQSLLSHSQISTIKQQNINLLKLFSRGTYEQYASQSQHLPKLSNKQVKTLKKLTVLSAFEGHKTVSISKLNNLLKASDFQTIQLLLQMGISDVISIKIDESRGLVDIFKAETRHRSLSLSDLQAVQARIANVRYKNSLIQKQLTDLTAIIK